MHKLMLASLLVLLPVLTSASTIERVLPDAELRGTATFRFVGFPIYEARLFTKSGAPLNWDEDFGLELRYLRDLTGRDIVEGTMCELTRTGAAIPIRGALEHCFDDVHKGDRYLAVSQGQNNISFWLNGIQTCTLSHPQTKTRFMAIFLGENTRSRRFTQNLKGE